MKRTIHGKMNGRPHFVPLAPQAVAILKSMQPLTGHGRYVFPSLITGERPMSENTVNTALRRMGFSGTEIVAHRFRSMARTVMVEQLPGINLEVIKAQLAGDAYDRAEFMEQRFRMMSQWAGYLDKLRTSADVSGCNTNQKARCI